MIPSLIAAQPNRPARLWSRHGDAFGAASSWGRVGRMAQSCLPDPRNPAFCWTSFTDVSVDATGSTTGPNSDMRVFAAALPRRACDRAQRYVAQLLVTGRRRT